MQSRIIDNRAVQWLAAALIAAWIRFVFLTSRHTFVGFEAITPLVQGKRPFVACCWHGRMMLICCVRPRAMRAVALISAHHDGQLAARTMRLVGVRTIVGSSSRGGHGAIRQCVAALANGALVVITPDGPRGPARVAAPGAIEIARLAGVPIVPVSHATSRARRLRSWDESMFPLPFARDVFICGTPIEPPSSADAIETARRELQARLIELDERADWAVAAWRKDAQRG